MNAPGAQPDARPRALVLVVDDNHIDRTIAKALLARRGLSVDVANDGLQAAEMAAQGNYDVILMDCNMPEVDGLEATRRIRAADRDSRVPIIAMTAYSEPGDRARCLAAGMDDYLSKPVRLAEVDNVLGRWLSDRQPG